MMCSDCSKNPWFIFLTLEIFGLVTANSNYILRDKKKYGLNAHTPKERLPLTMSQYAYIPR